MKGRLRFRKGFDYLCGDNVELELLPVVVSLLECLNLFSESVDRYGAKQKKRRMYICLRPCPHALSQSFEAHLQGWDLIGLAKVGLKTRGNVFPW